jgi:hypothetical protein
MRQDAEQPVGLGPIEQARKAQAQNDAAFEAAFKPIVMGAGVFSAAILLGNAVEYLARRRAQRKSNAQ